MVLILKKRISLFLIIILIVVLTAMLLGFVHQWPYSASNLKLANAEIELEVGNYENNLLENEQKKNELSGVEQELNSAQKEAPDLTKYEARFHYPSLLILLEEEAISRELSLEIHHSQIQHNSHMIAPEVPEETEEGGDKEEVKEEDVVPPQRGVDVTVIPISIKGEYDSIRDYIVFLEEKDYISVDSYSVTADETNKADIQISVFSVIVN